MRAMMAHADSKGAAAFTAVNSDQVSFHHPWQATAFALVLALQDRQILARDRWSAALGVQIQCACNRGMPDDNDTYYKCWLAALEQVLTQEGLTTPSEIQYFRHAWLAAAARTPHGKPIVLTEAELAYRP